jgi:hypothetical protein
VNSVWPATPSLPDGKHLQLTQRRTARKSGFPLRLKDAKMERRLEERPTHAEKQCSRIGPETPRVHDICDPTISKAGEMDDGCLRIG